VNSWSNPLVLLRVVSSTPGWRRSNAGSAPPPRPAPPPNGSGERPDGWSMRQPLIADAAHHDERPSYRMRQEVRLAAWQAWQPGRSSRPRRSGSAKTGHAWHVPPFGTVLCRLYPGWDAGLHHRRLPWPTGGPDERASGDGPGTLGMPQPRRSPPRPPRLGWRKSLVPAITCR
jgi:hypothetical protein